MLLTRESVPTGKRTTWDGLSVQLLGQMAVALLLSIVPPLVDSGARILSEQSTWNTAVASLVAATAALIGYRRFTSFPGTRGFAFVLPSYAATFGVAAAVLLLLRVDYSGSVLFTGFVASTAYGFAVRYYRSRGVQRRFYLVPFGNTDVVEDVPEHEWIMLLEPTVPSANHVTVVADLRADHPPEWERMLAQAALLGVPVFHTKQLRESLTGRVEIEHLSENSLGSLIPNLAYRGVKRAIDIVASVIALPLLALPMLVVAALIKFDSPGSALFRQERVGYRGERFQVLKFRTMRDRTIGTDTDAVRHDAITQAEDDRITRIGRVLRRTRLDELPQIFNVLAGEMSWIGPRPEAVPLSIWYEEHLPFYVYRHIVRPGITGWAQVSQGHVAELEDVHVKLHYDFYYIKNFSAWLDMLIALRTVAIMLTGFGSR